MKLRKKIVIDISFCFWSVWLFNHTHGHSLRIGASTKKLLGLGNLWSTYQPTRLDRKKTWKGERERENEEKITDTDKNRFVVDVV